MAALIYIGFVQVFPEEARQTWRAHRSHKESLKDDGMDLASPASRRQNR
jgi:hypothetical protein